MKKLTWLASLGLTGCASFTTRQQDLSIECEADHVVAIRFVETKATARAFFEASSKLAQFKATQTDKTQSASVGSLNQEASATNVTAILEAAAKLIKEAKSPVPLP